MSLQNLVGISLEPVKPDKALVSDAAAAECLASAKELLVHVRAWLAQDHSELL